MKFTLIVVALLIALASPVSAEQNLGWSKGRTIAAVISDALVATNVTIDTVASFRSTDRKDALLRQGCREGIAVGGSMLVKSLVSRTRPDGSDNKSFLSQHTATAFAAAGRRLSVTVPIAIGAGYMRTAAAKHYATDVLAGAGLGIFANWVCNQ